MGKGNRKPSWSIPEYQDPTYKTFSTGYGNTSYNNGNFSYNPSASGLDFQNQLQATRSALLKSMGGTDKATNDSLNQWQKTYFDEANRLSQPQLEQSLFSRGLGGSNFYANSLNDLITKNTAQSILNKYQLQNQDFNQNQTAFNNVNSSLNNEYTRGDNLLKLNADYANNQDNRNLDLYKTTLPYKAQYDDGRKSLNGWQQALSFMSPIGNDYFKSQGYKNVPGYGTKEAAGIAGAFMGMPSAGGMSGSGGGGMNLNSLMYSGLPSNNFSMSGSQGSNADLAAKYGYIQ